MGNWNLSIHGIGAHHNPDYPKDADRMARRFVQELKEAGHVIESAALHSGSKTDLTPESIPPKPHDS